MMRFLIKIVLCLMIAFPVSAEYVLAVYGDSLAAGYHLSPEEAFYTQLEKALKEKGYDVSVLHASRSGRTTRDGVKALPDLLAKQPNGVILELGVNDAIRKVDLQTTENNLKQMIEAFQNNQIPVLLAGMQSSPNRSVLYRQQFEEMYQRLSEQYGLVLYPFFMDGIFEGIIGHELVSNKVLPDKLHPNPDGVITMVQGIMPTVEQFLNQQNVYPR